MYYELFFFLNKENCAKNGNLFFYGFDWNYI